MRLEVVFAAHAARNPDKEALVCGDRRVSYRELKRRIREVAGGLARQGVGAGDAIVLYLPNGIPFVELLYAAFSLGAKVVPVTTRNTIRELKYFCEDSAAKIVVCDDRSIDGVRSILADVPALKAITIGAPQDGFISYDDVTDGSFTLPSISLDHDLAMILYTSGTTGRPKGVLLTHANILVNHGFMNGTDWGINHTDRFLVVSPLAHRAGLGRLMNAMTLGGTLVILPRFDADEIVAMMECEAITVFGMVPTICRMLLPTLEQAPDKARTLRLVAVTGEAFPVELKKRFLTLLPHTRLVSFFFDLNQGAIVALPGVAAALLVWGWRRNVQLTALCLALVLALILPALAVLNWNSGAAGVMRYAFWAGMPLVCALLLRVRAHGRWPPLLVLWLVLAQGGAMLNAGSYTYVEFSPLARFVLAHAPDHYHPEPEIFAERMAHNDDYIQPDKVYVYRPVGLPPKALFNAANKNAGAQLCGAGRTLASGNRIVESAHGWRYLDGAPLCTPAP